MKLFIYLSLVFSMISSTYAGVTKSIYGDDDRHEISDTTDHNIQRYAQATAAMVYNDVLHYIEDLDSFIFPTSTLEEDYNLCSNERFGRQTHIANCSGFLIAPDLIATAGHCVESATDCQEISWVFGYTNKTQLLKAENVYRCKKIITRGQRDTFFRFADFAIIQLDRRVEGRDPLEIRLTGRVKKGSELVMLGHPSGLPLKYDANGRVARHWNKFEKSNLKTKIKTFFQRTNYFTADVDAFAGNSGSPVINKRTGKVEGILISGAQDYFFDFAAGCTRTRLYDDKDSEVQEVVFKINKIKGLRQIIINHQ